jgi:hypothetical protein
MTSVSADRATTSAGSKTSSRQRFLEWGGIAAGVLMILFGVGAIALSVTGHNTVQDELSQQQIVGTPDMTPSAIAEEAKAAGLPASIPLPTCSVAGKSVDTGDEARCFAQYMQVHAYESTGGVPYAQMPRYATEDGKGTNDATQALTANGRPVDNPGRSVWINETALSTALNTSYMAEQLARFGIVVGIALLLSGNGFIILALAALRPRPDGAAA